MYRGTKFSVIQSNLIHLHPNILLMIFRIEAGNINREISTSRTPCPSQVCLESTQPSEAPSYPQEEGSRGTRRTAHPCQGCLDSTQPSEAPSYPQEEGSRSTRRTANPCQGCLDSTQLFRFLQRPAWTSS